jgi:hypothetical protein
MRETLRTKWTRWREDRRRYVVDRALDKAARAKRGNDNPDIQPPPPGVGGIP